MAEYRPIKIKMWHDTWFLKLSPEDKLLWVFLLTNEYVHISGVYELPLSLITPLTGIEAPLEGLTRFQQAGKIMYQEGWLYIINYLWNQTKQINKKDNIIKGIIAYLGENPLPCRLFDLINKAPYKELITPLGKEESSKVVKDINGETVLKTYPQRYERRIEDQPTHISNSLSTL